MLLLFVAHRAEQVRDDRDSFVVGQYQPIENVRVAQSVAIDIIRYEMM